MNNSKQDPAYVRQPLGYELFQQSNFASFRCNFATVTVSGKFWGGEDVNGSSTPSDGVYVYLESHKKKFLENRFNNDKGNAYELGYLDDFKQTGWLRATFLSKDSQNTVIERTSCVPLKRSLPMGCREPKKWSTGMPIHIILPWNR